MILGAAGAETFDERSPVKQRGTIRREERKNRRNAELFIYSIPLPAPRRPWLFAE